MLQLREVSLGHISPEETEKAVVQSWLHPEKSLQRNHITVYSHFWRICQESNQKAQTLLKSADDAPWEDGTHVWWVYNSAFHTLACSPVADLWHCLSSSFQACFLCDCLPLLSAQLFLTFLTYSCITEMGKEGKKEGRKGRASSALLLLSSSPLTHDHRLLWYIPLLILVRCLSWNLLIIQVTFECISSHSLWCDSSGLLIAW